MNTVKVSRTSGKNIWVNFYDDTEIVKSETRPAGDFIPAIPKSRKNSQGYTPYDGVTEWERAANKYMARHNRQD